MKKAIIIVGTGRSGTTLLYDILSHHGKCGYLNQYNNKFPNYTFLSFLSKAREMSLFKDYSMSSIQSKSLPKYYPKPAKEANNVWKYWDRRYGKINEYSRIDKQLNHYIDNILKYQGKQIFLSKNTNHGLRMIHLDRAFNAPFFIHIVRDPRAVVNSLLKMDWNNLVFWWREDSDTLAELKSKKVDLVKLWTLNLKKEIEIIMQNQKNISGNLLTIRYEDLTEETPKNVKNILDYCGLEMDKNIREYLAKIKIDNRNYKYKNELKVNEIGYITNETKQIIEKYGYEE